MYRAVESTSFINKRQRTQEGEAEVFRSDVRRGLGEWRFIAGANLYWYDVCPSDGRWVPRYISVYGKNVKGFTFDDGQQMR